MDGSTSWVFGWIRWGVKVLRRGDSWPRCKLGVGWDDYGRSLRSGFQSDAVLVF